MKLSSKQKLSIRESNRRLNIWEGAVRSGKTIASILRFIKFVGSAPRGGELIMIGKSIGSLYRNIIRPMEELLGSDLHYYIGKQQVHLWGRVIFCFGAYDESSEAVIRGLTVVGAYGDEVTLWPASFFKMLLSRMSVEGAMFFGTTNPDSPYHYLKTEFIDRASELDMVVFHFELGDNPGLSETYKVNLKKEYVGLWYRRFILGLWVAAEGAIYDFFDESVHSRDLVLLPKALEHVVGIDYGTGNPTAFIMMGRNINTKPKIWAADEYVYDSAKMQRQKTDDEQADDFIKFIKPYHNVTTAFIDPSAASLRLALRKKLVESGLFVQIRDAENDVINGIRVQATMLKNGDYALCRQKCKRTIQDYYGYSWDPKAQLKGEDKPLKTGGADHTKDGERYPLYTIFGSLTSVDYNALLTQ